MDVNDLSITSLVIGFFVLFSLMFNGGLTNPLYNNLIIFSGITFMLAGTVYLLLKKKLPTFILVIVTGVAYLPTINHRFSYTDFIDWVGFQFDVAFILLIGYMLIKFKPT